MSDATMRTDVPVTLLFADGVARQIVAQPGQKLLEAAQAAGLTLLTDCANGLCGTCTASCVSGTVDMDAYDTRVLPDEERADGGLLCCVARLPAGRPAPVVIELPYDASEASAEEAPAQSGRVASVTPMADEIMRLVVGVDQPVDFLPGQYVRLRPEGAAQWRSYSMANAPGARELVFYVRTVAQGAFSQWLLTQARPGDRLEVGAARGSFFLREDEAPRLLVAGGTGLAPFLAMLRGLRGSPAARVPTRLLVGARSGAHLFAQEEIARLQQDLPALQVQYAVEHDAPAGCHTGFATDLIAREGVARGTRVYLCGPPPMVEAGRAAALRAGLRKGDVLCERFA